MDLCLGQVVPPFPLRGSSLSARQKAEPWMVGITPGPVGGKSRPGLMDSQAYADRATGKSGHRTGSTPAWDSGMSGTLGEEGG